MGRYGYVRYSPDGRYLAIESEPDILVYDISSKSIINRVERASYPVWGPGPKDITFYSTIDNTPGIYKTDINMSRTSELVLTSGFPVNHSYAWSPSGTTLAFTETKQETGTGRGRNSK